MALPQKDDLGAFPAGTIPPDLEVTFTDYNGNPLNIAAFSARQMNIEVIPPSGGVLGGGLVPFVTDGSDGKVKYVWQGPDMATPGDYQAQIWISDGVKKLASDLIVYTVYDGPGTAP